MGGRVGKHLVAHILATVTRVQSSKQTNPTLHGRNSMGNIEVATLAFLCGSKR